MSRERLDGRVVILSVHEPDGAAAVADAGAAVVVVGSDAAAVGEVVDGITRRGGRACAFIGNLGDLECRDALVTMVAELFPRAD